MKILAEPIEAAVWFRSKEKPHPVKFRDSDRDGRIQRINVDKVVSVEEIKTAGIRAFVYRCQSEIDGIEKVYELKYLVGECRWELYKM